MQDNQNLQRVIQVKTEEYDRLQRQSVTSLNLKSKQEEYELQIKQLKDYYI